MIFIANVLTLNGGTTFLVRTCRELARRGHPVAVLVLRREYEKILWSELSRYADIFFLDDFLWERGTVFRAHLGIFGPLKWRALGAVLSKYPGQIHVMGVFGLLFALRLSACTDRRAVTTGIYHQNEFLFRAPDFYFAKEAIHEFGSLPDKNIVFFNESVRRNYQRFFGSLYSESTLIPIGIDFPSAPRDPDQVDAMRIVSVGNLVRFKTYNVHMISVVAALVGRFPNISYDIYGSGPEEAPLRELVEKSELGLHVRFMGEIPYSDFRKVVESAALFVGSGTALIEAGAIGVPAMVGIESIDVPETYGFLSDIQGFSYNENMAGVPKFSMRSLAERLLSDTAYRSQVGNSCREKARLFSVEATVDGFVALDQVALPIQKPLGYRKVLRLAISFVRLALAEKLKLSGGFSARRNQSY